jgi:hypothetical protein
MVTYKTLEDFMAKCKNAKEALELELESAKKHLRYIEDSHVSVQAQIDTLTQLMDVENNPSSVELPMAGDKIEEVFEKRLGDPELPNEEEMRQMRQEGVYKSEALGIVDQIDEINSEDNNGEGTALDSS